MRNVIRCEWPSRDRIHFKGARPILSNVCFVKLFLLATFCSIVERLTRFRGWDGCINGRLLRPYDRREFTALVMNAVSVLRVLLQINRCDYHPRQKARCSNLPRNSY